MMDELPGLHVFGFTANPITSAIGGVIDYINNFYDDRFQIRFSGEDTEVIETASEAKGIICPVQREKTDCCGTCGLCWQTDKRISFLRH